MTYPIPNYSRVWVRGRIIDLGKAVTEQSSYGVSGSVTFTPSAKVLINAGTQQIIASSPFRVAVGATNGYFAIQLPATDDPDVNPTNFTYNVSEPTGRTYNILVPQDTPLLNKPGDPLHGQPVIELSDVVPAPGPSAGLVQLARGRGLDSITVESGNWVAHYDDDTSQIIGPAPTGGGGASNLSDLSDVDVTGAAVGSLSALRRSQDGTSYSLEQALGGKAQSVGKEFRLVLAGDQTGGIGGNGTVNGDTDSTPKLTIQSWQSPHGPNVGGFGQGIRLDVMHPLAKNLLVWRMPKDPTTAWSETNYLQDVLWMGAHYRHTNPDNTPGDVGAHFHWSIEIPDANGALQTRWQIKIGDVATGKIGLDRTNIVTSNADTTIAAENGMFRLAADTAAKIIEFAQNQPGTGKFFQLKVDGAANNDLILTRYLSDSNSFTAMRVQRSTGRVAFGQAAVEAGAAFTLAWSEPTDRGFVAKPSVSTTTNAAFTALLAATTDRAIDIRDAAGSTPIFEVSGTGVLAWGPGSAGRDTNLYRAGADLLATDDAFRLANRGTTPGTPSSAAVVYASGGVLTAKNASGDVISLAKQTAVADVTGGTTIDTETRAALNALLARLRTIGLIAA